MQTLYGRQVGRVCPEGIDFGDFLKIWDAGVGVTRSVTKHRTKRAAENRLKEHTRAESATSVTLQEFVDRLAETGGKLDSTSWMILSASITKVKVKPLTKAQVCRGDTWSVPGQGSHNLCNSPLSWFVTCVCTHGITGMGRCSNQSPPLARYLTLPCHAPCYAQTPPCTPKSSPISSQSATYGSEAAFWRLTCCNIYYMLIIISGDFPFRCLGLPVRRNTQSSQNNTKIRSCYDRHQIRNIESVRRLRRVEWEYDIITCDSAHLCMSTRTMQIWWGGRSRSRHRRRWALHKAGSRHRKILLLHNNIHERTGQRNSATEVSKLFRIKFAVPCLYIKTLF